MYFRKADGLPPQPVAASQWPATEYWTGIIFNGAKIGFSHFKISPAAPGADRYDIYSEAYLRTRLLWIDKTINLKSYDQVDTDLSLIRFHYQYDLDGSKLVLTGVRQEDKLEVSIHSRNQVTRQTIHLQNDVYPSSVTGLYPLLHGLQVGRRYRYDVFDGQTRQVGPFVQEILAFEESDLFSGAAFKIDTRFQGHKVTTWMDAKGMPLLEMSLGGIIIAVIEDEFTARRYLTQAALNKDETLLNFSLIKSDVAISAPDQLQSMAVRISGIPENFILPEDMRQNCDRSGHDVACIIQAQPRASETEPVLDPVTRQRYLLPTYTISARHPRVSALAKQIAAATKNDFQQVQAIVAWIQENIEQQPVDVFTALDVLDGGKAECQGHALLFAAFARTLDIPTRVVNGIVYSPRFQGFLYHTWNESHVDGRWLAIDATFGQIPVDATHIKLVEGHSPSDLAPLTEMIGRIGVTIDSIE
jgi:hypothetical protein